MTASLKTASAASIALTALLAVGTANAGFRMTAFGDTLGFDEIMSGDYDAASEILDSRYAELNRYARHANLCVSLLKSKDVDRAMMSCQRALNVAPTNVAPTDLSSSLMPGAGKRMAIMTHLYSNRGVVRAVAGDAFGARADFERALALDADNANARMNLEYISVSEVAQTGN
jgi:Tfp pilus assembly protein PilF